MLTIHAQVLIKLTTGDSDMVTFKPLYYLSLFNTMKDLWTAKVSVLAAFGCMLRITWVHCSLHLKLAVGFRACVLCVCECVRVCVCGLTLTHFLGVFWCRYALSIFTLVTGGVLPYLRALVLLILWAVPLRFFANIAEGLFLGLDMMGKWTLSQAWILLFIVTSFRYHIHMQGIDSSGDPASGAVDIFMAPDWFGYWGIALASVIGMVGSHIMLYHVRTTLCWKNLQGASEPTRYRLCEQSGGHVLSGLVTLLLVATTAAMVYAVQVPAFRFEFEGAVRLLKEGLGDDPSTSYSLVDVFMVGCLTSSCV